MLFIKPSTEKIFNELVSIDIEVLIVFISSAKQISFLNKFSPRLLIAKDILEFKSKIICKIKKEKLYSEKVEITYELSKDIKIEER